MTGIVVVLEILNRSLVSFCAFLGIESQMLLLPLPGKGLAGDLSGPSFSALSLKTTNRAKSCGMCWIPPSPALSSHRQT